MAHVLDLLGCVANGATTDEALAATPAAIRNYVRFLQQHGTDADPDAEFAAEVAQHITEGTWLGNGSPYVDFPPDLQPISQEQVARYLEWLVGCAPTC